MLFFIHIPKAAGTSLRVALMQALGARLVPVYEGEPGQSLAHRRSEALPDDAVLFGHLWWGAHKAFAKPPRYAAVFRHPVDRLASWYDWTGRHRHLPLHDEVRRGVPLRELVERGASNEVSNVMTTMLAGRRPRSLDDRETLAVAADNLRDCAFVSTLDRLDDDLGRLSRLVGADIAALPRENSGSYPPPDAETREIILRHNALDLELFRLAESLR